MMEIKGIGRITVAGFFAEVGDLSQYKDPRQIIKLAGLNLRMNKSGRHKGKTTITKGGRRRLRALLYEVVRPLARHWHPITEHVTQRRTILLGQEEYRRCSS